MLIRFVVQNVLSFAESKEFNMLPRPKIRTPEGHKYSLQNVELLKLSAVYGANAAGKSNLVKALGLLQSLATGKISASKVHDARFKFDQSAQTKQMLAVEFVQKDTPYYYAVEIMDGEISTEELYRSGLGKSPDVLLFERKKTEEGATQLTFSAPFEKDAKSQVLKSILLEEFLEKSKTILPWLAKRENPYLSEVKSAFEWFEKTLQIISPESKPAALALQMDFDQPFKSFAHDMLCAYGLGISKIDVEVKPIEEVVRPEHNENTLETIRETFAGNEGFITLHHSQTGDELVVVKENGSVVGKQLKITQSDKAGQEAEFHLNELSDGTIRLLDFLPAFWDVVLKPKVYVVDELERSMHPALAKELVSTFSHDPKTRGQLIFTTHESNLLDQSIFRQDEVWFAEKSPAGSTDLYSLSDFKEHHTIDIRKGYLNGRYGAIPFLANLQNLNWHSYAAH
jgi:uncharacterized protein